MAQGHLIAKLSEHGMYVQRLRNMILEYDTKVKRTFSIIAFNREIEELPQFH